MDDIGKELARSSWKPKPGESESVTMEKLLTGTEDAARAMDSNIKKRVE
jgi:hypothetical protein